ncbi:MAG TPA: Uma2 family endonuclease [Gemmataceae bacterium]|jgi:Uma2 family endonuclease
MPAIVLAEDAVIPAGVVDHASFCEWALSDDFPQRGRFGFFNDSVWVSFEMETENHNWIKTIITMSLTTLILAKKLGRFYSDRMMFSHPATGLATEPDGMFVSTAARRSGQVTVRGGRADLGGAVILEGTPDMVLEVVSPGSVTKDTVDLVDAYWRAGIPEYWLVDPRGGGPPQFTLYAHAARGYKAVRPAGGWRKSAVFGVAVRLTSSTDDLGLPTYALETR